jgi:hypothetical protein
MRRIPAVGGAADAGGIAEKPKFSNGLIMCPA